MSQIYDLSFSQINIFLDHINQDQHSELELAFAVRGKKLKMPKPRSIIKKTFDESTVKLDKAVRESDNHLRNEVERRRQEALKKQEAK